MKSLLPIFVAGVLVIAGVSLVGCSNSQNPPPADQGSTAGGNGAFGTSPARPGSYEGDKYNQQGVTPTTQPSNSQ
jgi:hypothetical protein